MASAVTIHSTMTHISALLLFLLAGCAIGRQAENVPLEQARIEKLVPGKTSALEVVEIMGAPVDVIQLGRRSAYGRPSGDVSRRRPRSPCRDRVGMAAVIGLRLR